MNSIHGEIEIKNSQIFIWQAMISHHQYSTFLLLRDMMDGRITCVIEQDEDIVRKNQGWESVDITKLNAILLPGHKYWRDGIRIIRENPNAIHVFVAFRGTSRGSIYFPLILYCLIKRVKVAVVNEAYSVSPIGYSHEENYLFTHYKVWFRPIMYYIMALLINLVSGSQKPCLFPLSLIAKEQFKKAGFIEESIFPWGWFVPRINCDQVKKEELIEHPGRKKFRIGYFGSFLKTKGPDILVQAVIDLRTRGYCVGVDLYGSGNGQNYEYPEEDIFYKGLLPYESVQPIMRNYDVVVVPSRHDGWGVVVNQALLQGVPVIASSKVGAKCLLESSKAGLVFESENIHDLAEKIKKLMENPLLLKELQDNALTAGEKIVPERGAQYFLDALAYFFYNVGIRPTDLWSDSPLDNEAPQNAKN